MIKIEYNAKLIQIIKGYGWPLDYAGTWIFILFCLYEDKTELLNLFDDVRTNKRVVLMYRHLQLIKLVNIEDGEITLTDQGKKVVYEIKSTFKEKVTAETFLKSDPDFISFIEQYNSIFPDNTQRALRCKEAQLIPRMIKFRKEYPEYSKDTILQATRAYINAQGGNYTYTRNALYFIYKGVGSDKVSDLANYCYQITAAAQTDKKLQDFENM